MFSLQKRMRKANRGSSNTPETRKISFSTSSTTVSSSHGIVEDASITGTSSNLSHDPCSHPGHIPQPNAEWLKRVMQRSPDRHFLQPSFLTEDELLSINSGTESIYRKLKPWQTRLLLLHPGDVHSTLKCSLLEVDVIDGRGLGICDTSEVANYEALSYAWGDPATVCSITCNETQFGVALELATALQYLRSSTTDRYIWCDAICINQRDLSEKAHQVKNMLRIFEKADLVIAWLGQACSLSGRVFDALQLVNDRNYRVLAQSPDDPCFRAVEELMTGLHTHLASAWFVRTWVRQEVFASRQLIVQFGQYQLDFEMFIAKIRLLEQGYLLCVTNRQVGLPSTLPVYERDYQHRGTDRPNFEMKPNLPSYTKYWIEVLRSGSLFKVSDERDRIYGALGLLTSASIKFFARLPSHPESLAESFPIDYKKTVSQVFEDVTKFLINTSKTLEILDVFGDRRYLEASKVASWGTDWSQGTGEREEFGLCDFLNGDVCSSMLPLKQDYIETGKLRLSGLRVAGSLVWLDGKKEISHPRDRFMPKYRRSVTLQEIMKRPTRRTVSGLANEIYNPPYSVVFTHVEETDSSFELKNVAIKSDEFPSKFGCFLAGNNYIFAYVDDLPSDVSLELGDLHLLVPRTATLDDIVVSLHGSKCLHLLRSTSSNPSEFKYLGPIAGIACGQEYVLKYASKTKSGVKIIDKSRGFHSRETFVLV